MRYVFNRQVRVLLVALAVFATIGVATASAHVRVAATSPARNSTASTSLRTVKVLFTGAIRRGTLKVYSASGRKVSLGTGGRDPRNIRRLVTGLRRGLAAGRYTARWSIVAADGHTLRGYFRFRLRR